MRSHKNSQYLQMAEVGTEEKESEEEVAEWGELLIITSSVEVIL